LFYHKRGELDKEPNLLLVVREVAFSYSFKKFASRFSTLYFCKGPSPGILEERRGHTPGKGAHCLIA
jgi:hypothetical protein